MEEEKNEFKSLTSKVLDKNREAYNKALDFAFNNNDIKNIAIAGNYGAGKSTVWNTYVHERKIKNVIMISLGKYEDEPIKHFDKEKEEQNEETKKEEQIEENNKIERKIINQILAQIKAENIPLSKYKFKENKSSCYTFKQTLPILFITLGIICFKYRKEIEELFIRTLIWKRLTFIFNVLLILYPIVYYAFEFIRHNKINISRISIKGTEANFGEEFKEDETILDRDMREIVYLLSNSDTDAVVFEDLDRYDNNEIFTKLRELNFLLNSYINTQKPNNSKPIRFVYMVRDGLFISKNRTKFFDFIISIVPIVDSKNSEAIILKELENSEHKIEDSLIFKISLYIDDMRLLKNIINEYKIFESIIPLKEFELDPNKLFSLIVLKNIFPKEFEQLQLDQGYVYKVINRKNKYRDKLIATYHRANKRLDYLEICCLNKFEAMASKISTKISYDGSENSTWAEILEKQSKVPKEKFNIKEDHYLLSINYDDFIENYVYKNDKEIKVYIEELPENIESQKEKLNKQKQELNKKIEDINNKTLKEILEISSPEKINEIFEVNGLEIKDSHYFSLIRVLIMEGLIDETYSYYIGQFHEGSLAINDKIFIKNIMQGKEQDIFLNIENPDKVIKKMEDSYYSRFNILNKNLLKTIIGKEQEMTKELMKIMKSVDSNNNYDSLVQIFDTYENEEIKEFTNIILNIDSKENLADNLEENDYEEKYKYILEILKCSEEENNKVFEKILNAVCVNSVIDEEKIIAFKEYIENYAEILNTFKEEEFDNFINKISENIKFKDLSKMEITEITRKYCEKINETNTYEPSYKNVLFISKNLLKKKIEYNNILDVIKDSKELSATQKYIEDNYLEFIKDYIDNREDDNVFANSDEILIEIINSELDSDYKKNYVTNNETVINDIKNIEEIDEKVELIDILLSKNKIEFTRENVVCLNDLENNREAFIEYINKNMNDDNYKEILDSDLSNRFINEPEVSEKVFEYSLEFENKPISDINKDLTKERVEKLRDNNLISITRGNLETMVNNSFFDEIIKLIENKKENEEEVEEATEILETIGVSEEFKYQLLNSNISFESTKKFLDTIETEDIKFEKINFDKIEIDEYLFKKELSSENINYICKNFKDFKLKVGFIEYIEDNNLVTKIEIENLNEDFLEVALSNLKYTDLKIELIISKIKTKPSEQELEKIISMVEEIAALATVWNHKWPELDNDYKLKIGKTLKEHDYVTIRNHGNGKKYIQKRKKHKKIN